MLGELFSIPGILVLCVTVLIYYICFNRSFIIVYLLPGQRKLNLFMDDIRKIRQKHGFSTQVESTDCGLEMKNIVIAKHISQGPWYKCSKGALYFIMNKD